MTKETQTVWKDRNGTAIMRHAEEGDPGPVRLLCAYLTVEKACDLRDALDDFIASNKTEAA